jgi:hypothetical protein
MLTAKGEPIQHEVTSTDKNGKAGRIILDIDGANLPHGKKGTIHYLYKQKKPHNLIRH